MKSLPHLSSDYSTYKTNLLNYNKILQQTIRRAKFAYHKDIFTKFRSDSKKTWKHINDILCRKRVSTEFPEFFLVNDCPTFDKSEIANRFNHFFL